MLCIDWQIAGSTLRAPYNLCWVPGKKRKGKRSSSSRRGARIIEWRLGQNSKITDPFLLVCCSGWESKKWDNHSSQFLLVFLLEFQSENQWNRIWIRKSGEEKQPNHRSCFGQPSITKFLLSNLAFFHLSNLCLWNLECLYTVTKIGLYL